MTTGSIHQNQIVASLPGDERFRIVRLMEPVDVPAGAEILRSPAHDDFVWFPTSGLVSIVSAMADGSAVECGAVGMEGWVGVDLFAGSMPAGVTAFQQLPGSALRMQRAAFLSAWHDAPAFAAAVSLFRGLMLSYAMQTAACNRLHDATARCARWLLFTYERVCREDLAITHQYIAQMVGTSRSAVTATMSRLESQGLIERSRAHVLLRDIDGLRRAACECHDVLLDVYTKYLAELSAS